MSFAWRLLVSCTGSCEMGPVTTVCSTVFGLEAKASLYLALEQSNGHGARNFKFFYNP